uniref:IgGFc_binding domain-containing protein n=1 Tax=Panagrellus redivivus TaxID=6233 RepID=A0A7E4VHV8_PANRE
MDRELLDTPYVNPKKLDLVEVQVGHNSKNSGTIHAIDSYRMVNNSYPFNINDQSHKGFVIITLKEDIPIDDDNTIFICQTKSVPNDTTFYVVGQNLQEAASGDYNINNGYSVGSMNAFPCHNHPDMLCLYSHETGLVSINAGGPVLVYRPESRTTGRYYQVGFAVGGFIMEYADSWNVIHSIGYAHYEPTQDFCHWGINKLALDYGLFYCRDV